MSGCLVLGLAVVSGAAKAGASTRASTADPAPSGTPGPPVPEPVVSEAIASVGLVRSAGGLGSGWVAGPDMVVTNLHVARGSTGDIYMDFSDGERVECYTVVGDRDMDLAVLRCVTGARGALAIDTAIPDGGVPVAVVGYPRGKGPTTTRGVITGDRREVRGIETVGFTAGIEPGSSGSPVVDDGGEVRAVATFGGGLGVPIGNLVPLLETAEQYPVTKAGAEWRLRVRRSLLVVVLLMPLSFLVAWRRASNHPVRSAVRWTLAGVVVVLCATQAQFMLTGPAHFL